MSIGRNLKSLRAKNGWTQGDLSKETGIKVAHISKLENDEGDPKLSTLEKLIKALQCDADELLFDKKTSGLASVIKHYLKRILSLPASEKAFFIKLMDKLIISDAIHNIAMDSLPQHIYEEMAQDGLMEQEYIGELLEEEHLQEHHERIAEEMENIR